MSLRRNNTKRNQFSPLIMKYLKQAQNNRLENLQRMRETNNFGYYELATEIFHQMNEEDYSIITQKQIIDEISLAIEIEYAIMEELQLQNEEFLVQLSEDDEINNNEFNNSQFELSEASSDYLLCPFCRLIPMKEDIDNDLLIFQCTNCSKTLQVNKYRWNLQAFCEKLSDTFSSHKNVCSKVEVREGSIDDNLQFQQISDNFCATCNVCGYTHNISLS